MDTADQVQLGVLVNTLKEVGDSGSNTVSESLDSEDDAADHQKLTRKLGAPISHSSPTINQRNPKRVCQYSVCVGVLVLILVGLLVGLFAGPRHPSPSSGSPAALLYQEPELHQFSSSVLDYWEKLKQDRLANSVEILHRWPTFGDNFKNVQFWDESRRALCSSQMHDTNSSNTNLYPQFAFPEDLGSLDKGSPTHGLEFDPVVAKSHFVQYRAMLQEYYQNKIGIFNETVPNVYEKQRKPYMKRLTDVFVSKIVHSSRLSVGLMGTSVTAGTDNCYHYSFAPSLERMWAPMMKLVGVEWSVAGAGQDGMGTNSDTRHLCSQSIIGDVDILFSAYPMISGLRNPAMEAYLRRWLKKGTLLQMWEPMVEWDAYVPAGLSYLRSAYGIGQLHAGGDDFPWYPPLNRAFWKRPGDGTCHMWVREVDTRFKKFDKYERFQTASIQTNWHPGPLGVQVIADGFLWSYATAMIMALDLIQQALITQGESLQSLQQQYTLDRSASVELPPTQSVNCSVDPTHWLCTDDTFDYHCAVGHKPNYLPGHNISEWFIPQTSTDHPFPTENSTYQYVQVKSPGGYSDMAPNKSTVPYGEDCDTQVDYGFAYRGTGVASFRLPADKMKKGNVVLCEYAMVPKLKTWSDCGIQVWINKDPQTFSLDKFFDQSDSCVQVATGASADKMGNSIILTVRTVAPISLSFIYIR